MDAVTGCSRPNSHLTRMSRGASVGFSARADHAEHHSVHISLFLRNLLVPWTAINLSDFDLVRRGQYNVGELFKARGKYGLVNWPALAIYLVAMGAEIAFVNSSLYVAHFCSAPRQGRYQSSRFTEPRGCMEPNAVNFGIVAGQCRLC